MRISIYVFISAGFILSLKQKDMTKKKREAVPEEISAAALKIGFDVVKYAGITPQGVKFYGCGRSDHQPTGLPCYAYLHNNKVEFYFGFPTLV